jgi:hypothetical protein
MNTKLCRIRKKAVVEYFKVLFRHLPGGTDENQENPQSGQNVDKGTRSEGEKVKVVME